MVPMLDRLRAECPVSLAVSLHAPDDELRDELVPVNNRWPVAEVMGAPFPVVDADVPLDRLVSLLSKETPAALVRDGGRLVGIVNRYDVLREVAGIG